MDDLPGSEALEVAVKIADLALNNMNFFIIICAAFCGWALTSDSVATTKRFSGIRLSLATIFIVAAGSTAYGTYRLLERAEGAVTIAYFMAEEQLDHVKSEQAQAYEQLYRVNAPDVAGPALLATVGLVVALIVLYKRQ